MKNRVKTNVKEAHQHSTHKFPSKRMEILPWLWIHLSNRRENEEKMPSISHFYSSAAAGNLCEIIDLVEWIGEGVWELRKKCVTMESFSSHVSSGGLHFSDLCLMCLKSWWTWKTSCFAYQNTSRALEKLCVALSNNARLCVVVWLSEVWVPHKFHFK